ncbi:MAG: sodium:proton exchanger [Bacteroidetes bacterium HGW-Bacteroidetes-1]|jgi:cation:H+ antiporter|nr:MAG: sodium:proton exchanger [Bacteroidetes bacterium HGW-Bacteroidetes-1]
MLIEILLLIVGLTLLIFSADWLVSGASSLAKKMNVSDLAIGLTIVSFGTSAPEFVVNTFAAYQGNHDIVFGNVIGSNNFNLFIILGIAGLITPLTVQSSTVWKEIPLSLFAAVLLFFMVNDGMYSSNNPVLGRMDGIILIVMFVLFLFYVYKQLRTEPTSVSDPKQRPLWVLWGLIALGLTGLVIGGRLVVTSAVEMATALGVSEKIIGLTIIAAGTSLPELATSVVAAIKKNNDIAVGNIIGSNIFNVFLILSASSIIKPVSFNLAFNMDLYILAGGTLFLFLAMFLGGKKKLDRWEALILLLVYLGYTTWLVSKEV